MRSRRRGSKAAWFPIVGTLYQDGDRDQSWFDVILTTPSGTISAGARYSVNGSEVFATVLTLDDTPDVDNPDTGSSLRDFVQGQEYRLERLVGKVYGAIRQAGTDNVNTAMLGIGFAILPVSDEFQTEPALVPGDYNPLNASNAQAPWIWRRTWILANNLGANVFYYPQSTSGHGSVADGGHVDTRGARRRIRREQRLFMCVAASVVEGASSSALEASNIHIAADLRVLGMMRSAKGTSSFK